MRCQNTRCFEKATHKIKDFHYCGIHLYMTKPEYNHYPWDEEACDRYQTEVDLWEKSIEAL